MATGLDLTGVELDTNAIDVAVADAFDFVVCTESAEVLNLAFKLSCAASFREKVFDVRTHNSKPFTAV